MSCVTQWRGLKFAHVASHRQHRPRFRTGFHPRPHSLPRVARPELGHLVFAPQRFHARLHHRTRRAANLRSEFERRNVKVLAVSVDSLDSHRRWSSDIEETQDCQLDYPILADGDRQVARLYDMIHAEAGDTLTVRSVFFIDPAKEIRALITYPASTGRNFQEILRVIDCYSSPTPTRWPPPRTGRTAMTW